MTDARSELRERLGDLGVLERLDDEQADAVRNAVADARSTQAATIAAARDEALGHIPRLLRGSVRRVLGA